MKRMKGREEIGYGGRTDRLGSSPEGCSAASAGNSRHQLMLSVLLLYCTLTTIEY